MYITFPHPSTIASPVADLVGDVFAGTHSPRPLNLSEMKTAIALRKRTGHQTGDLVTPSCSSTIPLLNSQPGQEMSHPDMNPALFV
jgi:hypothetical protein